MVKRNGEFEFALANLFEKVPQNGRSPSWGKFALGFDEVLLFLFDTYHCQIRHFNRQSYVGNTVFGVATFQLAVRALVIYKGRSETTFR